MSKQPDYELGEAIATWRKSLVGGTDLLSTSMEKEYRSHVYTHCQYSGTLSGTDRQKESKADEEELRTIQDQLTAARREAMASPPPSPSSVTPDMMSVTPDGLSSSSPDLEAPPSRVRMLTPAGRDQHNELLKRHNELLKKQLDIEQQCTRTPPSAQYLQASASGAPPSRSFPHAPRAHEQSLTTITRQLSQTSTWRCGSRACRPSIASASRVATRRCACSRPS